MAIRCLPFIEDAFSQASTLRNLLNHGGAPLLIQVIDQNELSEEDIWEAAIMAAASRSFDEEHRRASNTSNSQGFSSRMVHSEPSPPLDIPRLSQSTCIHVDGVDYTEEKEGDAERVICRRRRHVQVFAAPHEVADRRHMASRRDEQVLAFSMTEGHGRTLKGRDLTNVRNAVWQIIGFAG